jgi:hypothetical protein
MKSVKQLGSLVLAVSIMSASAFAGANHSKKHCDFLPKNKLNIPVGMNLSGGIDEETFNQVIDEVIAYYGPIIKTKGGKLKMNRLWKDGTVNASAQQQGKTWIVNMYGGLARHSVTTKDGFALVLCHELGHHLGGFPEIGSNEGNPDWAANEGQSDYFATMKCFRRVYEKADNSSIVSAMTVPSTVKTKCSNTFKSADEINLCIRESMGGEVLADLLWSLANGGKLNSSKKPAFDTPDTSKVSETDDSHPAAQCRLDTYFAGSICGVSYSEDFGLDNPTDGACAVEKGDKIGVRPLCWYKPQ